MDKKSYPSQSDKQVTSSNVKGNRSEESKGIAGTLSGSRVAKIVVCVLVAGSVVLGGCASDKKQDRNFVSTSEPLETSQTAIAHIEETETAKETGTFYTGDDTAESSNPSEASSSDSSTDNIVSENPFQHLPVMKSCLDGAYSYQLTFEDNGDCHEVLEAEGAYESKERHFVVQEKVNKYCYILIDELEIEESAYSDGESWVLYLPGSHPNDIEASKLDKEEINYLLTFLRDQYWDPAGGSLDEDKLLNDYLLVSPAEMFMPES